MCSTPLAFPYRRFSQKQTHNQSVRVGRRKSILLIVDVCGVYVLRGSLALHVLSHSIVRSSTHIHIALPFAIVIIHSLCGVKERCMSRCSLRNPYLQKHARQTRETNSRYFNNNTWRDQNFKNPARSLETEEKQLSIRERK
jgi:predicted metal-binding membrane protein